MRAIAFIFFLFAFTNGNSQEFLSTSGKAIINESGDTVILKGMGLGGWMLQEGYMLQTASFANAQHKIKAAIEGLVGEQKTQEFYDAWLANHVTKEDIDSLASWGFNSVRLPMHYNLFTLPIEDEPIAGSQTWIEKGFTLTDSLISWCKANDMYVVLDLHAAPGGQGYDEGISDYDPSKPSLWESFDNKQKTVALWDRISERYINEPTIAGYDLLNEVNWNLSGNVALKNLYVEITEAIRANGDQHILFIEGNWFANDFTGLTPPWDDQLVYSPHKYWSFNDQSSINWALNIRDTHNVPIYFGETGENSNTWFRDAIDLFDQHQLGWAWWPMKKVESIAGPLSVTKTNNYQSLLNYWEGNGNQPSEEEAFNTLMNLTELLKIEHCTFQKDVVDAMFRQIESQTSIPYTDHMIPGIIYPTDFDMGANGIAYNDVDIANYNVSTGNFTAWNQGWSYRNDGVDIERTNDSQSNGFNVGWFEENEWLKYTVDVSTSGVYDIILRVASNVFGGDYHLSMNDVLLAPASFVPSTGGWNIWQDIKVENVVLTEGINYLKVHSNGASYNLNRIEFIYQSSSESLNTDYVWAETIDEQNVLLTLNKNLINSNIENSDFSLFANGSALSINNISLNPESPKQLLLSSDEQFSNGQLLKISYTGNLIQATDNTPLIAFNLKDVENKLPYYHPIPGLVQAENFAFQSGISVENCSDIGGGKNISFIDAGDYIDYFFNVQTAGEYSVHYRCATPESGGQLKLEILDDQDEVVSVLHVLSIPTTGDWNSWETYTVNNSFDAGSYKIRLSFIQGEFNLNWIDFILESTNTENDFHDSVINIYPTPVNDYLNIQCSEVTDLKINYIIRNTTGQTILSGQLNTDEVESINFGGINPGIYFIELSSDKVILTNKKILKL